MTKTITDSIKKAFLSGTIAASFLNVMNTSQQSAVVKMVIQGVRSVDMVRKIAGSTMPADADMGTIRGDYSVDTALIANAEKRPVRNIVHASETPEEAAHEIEHWFDAGEICEYSRSEEEMQF